MQSQPQPLRVDLPTHLGLLRSLRRVDDPAVEQSAAAAVRDQRTRVVVDAQEVEGAARRRRGRRPRSTASAAPRPARDSGRASAARGRRRGRASSRRCAASMSSSRSVAGSIQLSASAEPSSIPGRAARTACAASPVGEVQVMHRGVARVARFSSPAHAFRPDGRTPRRCWVRSGGRDGACDRRCAPITVVA